MASLEITKQRFKIYGLQGTFIQADAENLPSELLNETFDLIYSFGVLHHTPRPQIAIEKIKRMLGPHSEFRLMMYAKNSWKNIMIENGFDQPEAESNCPIAFTYSQDELRELLKGLDVFHLEQAHIFPYIVEKYIRYEYELQPWFKVMPREIFQALEKSLGWHTLIKCRLL
jgi:ubiquinone/menaquinone biosynthesis C-methylase UbiE